MKVGHREGRSEWRVVRCPHDRSKSGVNVKVLSAEWGAPSLWMFGCFQAGLRFGLRCARTIWYGHAIMGLIAT